MKQSLTLVRINIKIYHDYINYLSNKILPCLQDSEDNIMKAMDNYFRLNELVFKSVSELGNETEFDIEISTRVADGLYLTGNFVRAVEVASYALNYSSEVTLFFVCNNIILSKSMYALGNSGANEAFTRTVDIILAHNIINAQKWLKESFDWFLSECCYYLLHLKNTNYVNKCLSYRPDFNSFAKMYHSNNTANGARNSQLPLGKLD